MEGKENKKNTKYMYMKSTKEFRCGAINAIRSLDVMKKKHTYTHINLWNSYMHTDRAREREKDMKKWTWKAQVKKKNYEILYLSELF